MIATTEQATGLNPNEHPIRGGIYRALKGFKNADVPYYKGKAYVYDGESLKLFSTRSVNCLFNQEDIITKPGCFEPMRDCPFCNKPLFDEANGLLHNGYECAQAWDAKVKKYCPECNADTVAGKCPECDE